MDKNKGLGFNDPATSHLPKGKKILLGIGIDAYRASCWTPLNNAVRDVKEVAALLRHQYGFSEALVLTDGEATASNIEEQLYRLTDPDVLGEQDSLLIYYSGHGHLDRNARGYWVPVDAEEPNKIYTYLSNSRVRELIADLKCKHVLLISDACFSGSFFVRGLRSASDYEAAEEYEKRISRWALCSGRHDEVVSDGPPGGHSPFATAILQELQLNTTRKLNIARLADKVIEITRSNYRQMPEANPIQDTGHQGGQFVFTPKNYARTQSSPPEPISVSSPQPVLPRVFIRRRFLIGFAIILIAVIIGSIASSMGFFSSKTPQIISSYPSVPPDSGQLRRTYIQERVDTIKDGPVRPVEINKPKSKQDFNPKNRDWSKLEKGPDSTSMVIKKNEEEPKVPLETHIPIDVEMRLEPDDGEPIDAQIIAGKLVFLIPSRLKGTSAKITFSRNGHTDWRRQPLRTDKIILPDGL